MLSPLQLQTVLQAVADDVGLGLDSGVWVNWLEAHVRDGLPVVVAGTPEADVRTQWFTHLNAHQPEALVNLLRSFVAVSAHQPTIDRLRQVLHEVAEGPEWLREAAPLAAPPLQAFAELPERFQLRPAIFNPNAGMVAALDTLLERLVVIKGRTENLDRDRLRRQIRNAASHRHAAVVVYDLIETETHTFWVTEFLSQGNIERAASRASFDAIREYWRATLLALGFVHAENAAHLNLTPDNVLVRRAPSPESGAAVALTNFDAYAAMGTIGPLRRPVRACPYRAPEYRLDQRVDGRTDLFSVGKVFDALLEQAQAQLDEPPPEDLADVVRACVEDDPDRRPSSVEVALEGLRPRP